jgi:hypothetical protein
MVTVVASTGYSSVPGHSFRLDTLSKTSLMMHHIQIMTLHRQQNITISIMSIQGNDKGKVVTVLN